MWLRGGYPRSFRARDVTDSTDWRNDAINRYVEQDLRQLGIDIAPPTMLRFWNMFAHYHAQIWNSAPFVQSLGVSQPTVRKYLDILTHTCMVRQLQPWHENVAKRQVKAPKIFFRDSGLLHALMGVKSVADLVTHPHSGASWEGFALEQVLRMAKPDEAFFWATHQGAELDLFMLRGQQRIGVEFKRADAPKVTPSMRTAMDDLRLAPIDRTSVALWRRSVTPRVRPSPAEPSLGYSTIDSQDTLGEAPVEGRADGVCAEPPHLLVQHAPAGRRSRDLRDPSPLPADCLAPPPPSAARCAVVPARPPRSG